MDTKQIAKGIAEAIVAQDTDGLDRGRYILECAVEYLRAIEPENATLGAWRDKDDHTSETCCIAPRVHSGQGREPILQRTLNARSTDVS